MDLFLTEDDGLLEKCNVIWNRVNANIKKNDSESVYNKKTWKTKIKLYVNKATDFHNKEIPKVGSDHTSLVVIHVDTALKKDENYYLPVFLKERKYVEK